MTRMQARADSIRTSGHEPSPTPPAGMRSAVPQVQLDDDPALRAEILEAIADLAGRSAWTLGAEVDAFEAEFAAYCETEHAIGVSSGTDALALALRALGVGPGDEVVVPANSFIASAEAVTLVGATPRFADVDPFSANLTEETLAPALTPRTRAVIAVHLYGRTVDMAPIVALARAAGARVIEDACQAHGARYRGRRVGGLGDVAAFSFYPAKNLGAWGDGGAVTTDDPELADRIRLLRCHGERPRYQHRIVGTTARLDAIQAAVLRRKLPRLDAWNDARRAIARRLTAGLIGSFVSQPADAAPDGDHVYHQYVVTSSDRDGLRRHLSERGIATGVHYPVPIHRSRAYAAHRPGAPQLPVAERLAEQVCSLPMFPSMTARMVDRVLEAVQAYRPLGSVAS